MEPKIPPGVIFGKEGDSSFRKTYDLVVTHKHRAQGNDVRGFRVRQIHPGRWCVWNVAGCVCGLEDNTKQPISEETEQEGS